MPQELPYELVESDLKSIVDWSMTDDTDEGHWEDQVEIADTCLFEMQKKLRPITPTYKTGTRSAPMPIPSPYEDRLVRAIPHVETLLVALRKRNRVEARTSGNAALTEM